MTKLIFVQRVVYAYFGTMSISAAVKARGHGVELVMGSDIKKAAEETLALRPDIVAFSTLIATGEFEWAAAIAQELKKQDTRIITVFGGLHPSLFPEETMAQPYIDVLCRGEGEYAMAELCDSVEAGSDYSGIAGLWARRSGDIVRNPVRPYIKDLDALPFHDRELYAKYRYFDNLRSIDVLAGRGCPFECDYCYNHIVKDIYPENKGLARKSGVERLLAELKDIKTKYKPRSFTFVDELFTFNREWLREFADKYPAALGLPFICNIRADTFDEETASLLARAGAFRVCFGLETGNERTRREVLNKPITNAQMLSAAELLHRHGIKFLTANMLGLPGETVDEAFETVELNRRMKTDYLYFSIFQPYPKLRISEAASAAGLLPDVTPGAYNSTYFKASLLRQPGIRQLENLHKLFYPAVKYPWTKALIKLLIRLPANFVFDFIFITSFGWMQFSCFRRDPRQLLAMGLGNLKVFYSRRKKL